MVEKALGFDANPKTGLLAKYGNRPGICKSEWMIKPFSNNGLSSSSNSTLTGALPDLNINQDSNSQQHKKTYGGGRG